MNDQHPSFRENLAAYALGALDADKTAALDAHLRSCESCRAELAAYQRVSTGLLSALPPQAPRPVLRWALAARLPGAQRKPRWKWGWSFGQVAAAAAFLFLIGLNLVSFFQVRSLQAQQTALASQFKTEQSALALLSSPGALTLPVTGENVTGSLIVDNDTNSAILILSSLPALEAGETYQIWLIQPDEGRVSAGLFDANRTGGTTLAALSAVQPLQTFVGIGVTIEPAGGSSQPTGPKVLGVDF